MKISKSQSAFSDYSFFKFVYIAISEISILKKHKVTNSIPKTSIRRTSRQYRACYNAQQSRNTVHIESRRKENKWEGIYGMSKVELKRNDDNYERLYL